MAAADLPTTSDGAKTTTQHDTASADAANKMAADSQPAAGDKSKAPVSSSFDLGAAITSGIDSTETFLSSAMDYLPSINIFDTAGA